MSQTESRGQGHDLATFPAGLAGKRILLCTESFGPVNGVSRTTLMLVNHLRSHGANVAVVAPHNHTKVNTFVPVATPRDAPHGAPRDAPQGMPGLGASDDSRSSSGKLRALAAQNPEVRIHGYPLPYNPELSIVYPVRLSTLYAKTFASPPDLIYLASPASLGFQVLLQLRQQPREHQVPILANFQTDLSGYCAILMPPPFSDLAVYTFSKVEGFLFRHPSVKTIFYPSRFVKRYLEKNGVQPSKMQVLRRGVNTDHFNPLRRSDALRREIAPGGEIILVCVARLAGEKGFEFLSAVAKELDRRGLAFKLYIVGGNRNAAVEAEVQALFSDLRKQGRVIFAGFKVGDVLAEAYASADVFLHCSITETFGLVVLESMASGVPVVARDEGGPSDIVDHGVSGFLVPPADLDGFVDKVMLLAQDPELRKAFGRSAREQACEATWDKINNTVAWRMLDVIEQREREIATSRKLAAAAASAARMMPPFAAWHLWNDGLGRSIVDAKLFAGLGIIMGFWGVVGVYLVFIKLALWVKARLRW